MKNGLERLEELANNSQFEEIRELANSVKELIKNGENNETNKQYYSE